MTPEEWPIAASAADSPAPARRAGRERLATVRADFFLAPEERLTEQERALMGAMLQRLVEDVVGEIEAALPPGFIAANDGDPTAFDQFLRSGLLDISELFGLLLQSADQERLTTAARARNGRTRAGFLQGLVSHDQAPVSAAAMRLIIARGGRRDRFGQRLLLLDDVPRSVAEILVHACAAALRTRTVAHSAIDADAKLTSAAEEVLGRHDPSRCEAAVAAELAGLLAVEADKDSLLLAACSDGEVAIAAAMLAQRARVPFEAAFDELLSGSADRLATLFRLAYVGREVSVAVLAAVGDLFGITEPAEALRCFDRLAPEQLDACRDWLAAPAAYRAACEALETPRGHRAF